MDQEPSPADRFEALQQRLIGLWDAIKAPNPGPQTIVVLPSLSIDPEFLRKMGPRVLLYEERFLFLLLLLRQARAEVVFISSMPVAEEVIDYYLALMPGAIPAHARRRLHLVSADDDSVTPLASKLLGSPDLMARIRGLIPDRHRAHLVPFITTELEQQVALALDIPVYGAHPKFAALGGKSGGRRIFREEAVPHPSGTEELRDRDAVAAAVMSLREQIPSLRRALVKLNFGVSGQGNATIDLEGLPPPGAPGEREAVESRILSMQPEADDIDAGEFLRSLQDEGGVVEEMLEGGRMTSPSVQLRVTPLGELEVLSTHDQLLKGRGQTYLGCVFPADPAYAGEITDSAIRIGKRLAREGVIGRFAIDFITIEREDGWDHYAVEINLRKGGTTHPYLTLQFLTAGAYDPATATFSTPSGAQRCLIASDSVEVPAGMGLHDLFDIAVVEDLHYDNSRHTGVVFHMLGGLGTFGVIGMTAVAESRAEATALFDRTVEALRRSP